MNLKKLVTGLKLHGKIIQAAKTGGTLHVCKVQVQRGYDGEEFDKKLQSFLCLLATLALVVKCNS